VHQLRGIGKLCRFVVRCVFSGQTETLTLDVPLSETSVWRAVVRVLRSPVDSLSCALLPAICALCGASLLRLTRVPVCENCCSHIPPQAGILCACCGEAIPIATFSQLPEQRALPPELCQPCRLAPPAFAQAVAYGTYRGELRDLIHLLKYRGMEPIAGRLGGFLADTVEPFAEQFAGPTGALVIPVPMHAVKQRQRGFNQAERLARMTVRELRDRHPDWCLRLEPTLLRRVKVTVSQSGLTNHQRRQNLRGAFLVASPARVANRDILLIDDIYTTGATARACSRVLRNAGARSVRVATVARAQRDTVSSWDKGFLQSAVN
jgi:ComF family protein